MAQQTKNTQAQPSMADAIKRAKAAAAAVDRARAAGVAPTASHRRVFTGDVKAPDHPHARFVQKAAIGAVGLGIFAIVFLPDTFVLHVLAFALLFCLIFIGVPNFVLHKDGSLARGKLAGWVALLLFIGAMTTVATGTDGNLWSWAPWMQQFSAGHSTPPHVQPTK